MKIRFWGTRGSIPTPGKDTVEFGGNTACVELILSNGKSIIIDAGSGLRTLGIDYLQRPGASREMHLFISHAHWDHLQGFPFFQPALFADFTINIYSHIDIEKALAEQMRAPFFPLHLHKAPAKLIFHRLESKPVRIGKARVSFQALCHPQSVNGFRIDEGGASVVYLSDTEHDIPCTDKALLKFARGAGVLLFDSQYTPDEYAERIGWGHSTYIVATEIARDAGVKKLVLFHHEPTHTDKTIRAIEKKAQKLFPNTLAAREGQILEIP